MATVYQSVAFGTRGRPEHPRPSTSRSSQQSIDKHADRAAAWWDCGDAWERQLQKSQPNNNSAPWQEMPSRQHRPPRAHLPPNLGTSSVHLQPFVGENVHATVRVAAELRTINDFVVSLYGLRTDGHVGHLFMVADRLDFLRQGDYETYKEQRVSLLFCLLDFRPRSANVPCVWTE